MIFYSFMLFILILCLNKIKLFKVNQLFFVPTTSLVILGLQFFNLGGVPPLGGFLIKLFMLKYLVTLSLNFALFILLTSLGLLFLYVIFFYQGYNISPVTKLWGRPEKVSGQERGVLRGLLLTSLLVWLVC